MVTLAGLPPDEVEERSHAALQAGLQRVEAEIRAEAGVDQEHVMAAQAAYADDPAVEPLVAQLRSLFFGEEQLAELAAAQAAVPAGWVAADFVGPLKKHAAVVDARFAAIVERAARDTAGHGVSPGEVEQYLMMLLQREIDSILADAADAAGLSKDAFHGCMVKFGVDAAVAGVLADSNARQEALKASLLSGAASAGGGGGARGGARGGQTR